MRRTGIFTAVVEIIHCGEVVIFDHHRMHTDGMGHLTGRFDIEGRLGGQHAAKQCNIGGAGIVSQQVQFFTIRGSAFLNQCLCQLFYRLTFILADMHQLLNLQLVQRVILVGFFALTEHRGNLASPLERILILDATSNQLVIHLNTQSFGARTDMLTQRGLE